MTSVKLGEISKFLPEEAMQRVRAIASKLHDENNYSLRNIQLHLVLVSKSDLIWGPMLLPPVEIGVYQFLVEM